MKKNKVKEVEILVKRMGRKIKEERMKIKMKNLRWKKGGCRRKDKCLNGREGKEENIRMEDEGILMSEMGKEKNEVNKGENGREVKKKKINREWIDEDLKKKEIDNFGINKIEKIIKDLKMFLGKKIENMIERRIKKNIDGWERIENIIIKKLKREERCIKRRRKKINE